MKISIEERDAKELENSGVFSWPIWQCETSTFDWHYDQQEQCYILEGEITVKTATETVHIKPGDFVTFPKGLDCVWDVRTPVRKHYSFS